MKNDIFPNCLVRKNLASHVIRFLVFIDIWNWNNTQLNFSVILGSALRQNGLSGFYAYFYTPPKKTKQQQHKTIQNKQTKTTTTYLNSLNIFLEDV